MQINTKEYNKEIHDIYKALTVKQPYADKLVRPIYVRDGKPFAEKQIEVRSKPTSYRGELLICSSKKPILPGRESGKTIGFVELYDVKPVVEFTSEEWELTCIPALERHKYLNGYGWFMRNPRRVVEMPINGQLGIYNIVMPKGDITEYPERITIDEKDWRIIKAKCTYGKDSEI